MVVSRWCCCGGLVWSRMGDLVAQGCARPQGLEACSSVSSSEREDGERQQSRGLSRYTSEWRAGRGGIVLVWERRQVQFSKLRSL